MSGSPALASSPTPAPATLVDERPRPAARRGVLSATLLLLRGSAPGLGMGILILVMWYVAGLWTDAPFARQILGARASTGAVLRASLSLPSPFVPLPHQVLNDFFAALAQPLGSPRGLWVHMEATGLEAVLGLAAGAALGVAIATLFIYSPLMESAFLPYVVASQTVPILALAPVIVSILGITLTAKVVVSAYLAFFAVAISTIKGFKSAEPLAHELMRSYAASRWQVYRKLLFPVALPYLFAGLKIAATASLVGAIISELFGSTTGLGARLLEATTYNETIAWWSTILAGSALGFVLFGAISLAQRLVVKARPASAREG